jgi:ribonuclease BN (tRNA processing enzyme)
MEKNSRELVPLISGTLDAASIAQECGVKKMVVTHMTSNLTRPGSRERGIRDIARVYHGDLIFADELMRLTFT